MEQNEITEKLQVALERTEQRLAELEAMEKRRRTVNLIAWLAVLVIVIVGVCISLPKLNAAADTFARAEVVIGSMEETLKDVDLNTLSDNLAVLGKTDTEKLQDFVGTAGKIDFKALGEQLDGISQFSEKLSGLSEKLNALSEKMTDFSKLSEILTSLCEKLSDFNLDAVTGENGVLSSVLNPLKDLFK